MADEVTNFELLLTRGRALGISFLIAEQVPSQISRAARVSAHLVVGFCTTGSELMTTVELLGLADRRQRDALRSLGMGECIVALTGDRCPMPLRVRFSLPEIDRRNLTAKEREYYIARSLEGILAKPRFAGFIEQREEVKKRERDPNRLSEHAWKVFVRIAQYPHETIEERMAILNLNRAEEGTARSECDLKGCIKQAGTLGRGMKFFQLQFKGKEFAERSNVPVTKFKSGVVHEALLRRVMKGLSGACPSLAWTNPSGATGATQPDGYGLLPNGRVICVQVHCHNKRRYEVRKLKDLCRINHVDLVLMVVATQKARDALAMEISKQWKDGTPQKYVLLSATECLDRQFDWTSVLDKGA